MLDRLLLCPRCDLTDPDRRSLSFPRSPTVCLFVGTIVEASATGVKAFAAGAVIYQVGIFMDRPV